MDRVISSSIAVQDKDTDKGSGTLIDDAGADPAARRRGKLEEIARLIGRPVESLIHGPPPGDAIGDTAELIRLWQAIGSAEDRRRLLAATRALAAR